MVYDKNLQGLRALAVILVVLFHTGLPLFSGGFVGVDIFLVLSGYLMTGISFNGKNFNNFAILKFLRNRCIRILPLLIFVSIVTILLYIAIMSWADFLSLLKNITTSLFFISNISYWRYIDYFSGNAFTNPFLHSWSLSLEMQFYVLFALYIYVLKNYEVDKVKRVFFAIIIISLGFSIFAATYFPVASYYLLPGRLWQFFLGGLLCLFADINKSFLSKNISNYFSILGLILIFISFVQFNEETNYPGIWAILPVLGTCLIIYFSSSSNLIEKILGNIYFIKIGTISYGIYLWHQPIMVFIRRLFIGEPNSIVMFCGVLISILLAQVTYTNIENTFRLGFGRLAGVIKSLLLISLLLAITYTFIASKNPSSVLFDFNKNDVFESAKLHENSGHCNKSENIKQLGCHFGVLGGGQSLALVGDSYAINLMHQLSLFSNKYNIQGVFIGSPGCPPLISAQPVSSSRSDIFCNNLRNNFFRSLKINPSLFPDTFIVFSRWTLLFEKYRYNNSEGGVEFGKPWIWKFAGNSRDYNELMRDEILRSITAILNAGKTVILIYPVPEMGWDVPGILWKHFFWHGHLSYSDGSVSYQKYLYRANNSILALDSIPSNRNLIKVKPHEFLCNAIIENRCLAHFSGVPLYSDNNHLSDYGNAILMNELGPLILRYLSDY